MRPKEMTASLSAPPGPSPDGVLAGLRDAYLEAMVAGSDHQADGVVRRALDWQISIDDVYLGILQPVAYEIGNLWFAKRLTIAQEHLATSIIERQMKDVHSLFRPRSVRGLRIVIGCVEDELHRIGSRMVADFLEQDGWSVCYLGEAVPTKRFVAVAKELNAHVVGVSAQLLWHVPTIGLLAREMGRQGLSGIPILAGGQPFVQKPELLDALNLVGTGADARTAVRLAAEVIHA